MVKKPFDPTKPVQTRDGRKARILCTDYLFYNRHYILGAVLFKASNEIEHELIQKYLTNGRVSEGETCGTDLVNIVERTSKFQNIWYSTLYKRADSPKSHRMFNTLTEAAAFKGSEYYIKLGVMELIYEDGEFVDAVFHKASA